MRFWQTGIAAALALTIAASAVQAQVEVATVTDGETGASADRKADAPSLAMVGPSAGVAEVAQPPLLSSIVEEIEKRQALDNDDQVRHWLSELNGFYRMSDARPVWTHEAGYLPRGWEAVRLLQTADEYGLDPSDYAVPEMLDRNSERADIAAAEVDVSLAFARYAYDARGGRIEDPKQLSLWLDQKPNPVVYAGQVMNALVANRDVARAVANFHPRHPQFAALRRGYVQARNGAGMRTIEIPAGPVLKNGARSPDVVLIRERLGVKTSRKRMNRVDRRLLRAVRRFMRNRGYGRKREIDDEVRTELSKPYQVGSKKQKALLEKYVVNMERWRWVPSELGSLHVWNNLPEFETRVMKNGRVIHEERIVVGKAKTQTPIFSDEMTHVIFHPEWGVPESIKIRDLLPRLRGGDLDVLRRKNMRITAGGKTIRPTRYNWSKVDIRSVPIVQGAGSGNPLGKLKFIFPNHHAVYMHDTPSKHLFKSKQRTFSHGCIRVRDPQRFAEVILEQAAGWTPDDVAEQLKKRGTYQVDLNKPIRVHNVYFTLVADKDGTVQSLKDVYAHDKRVADALNGKSLKKIAARDPALALKRENERLKKVVYKPKPRYDGQGFPIDNKRWIYRRAPNGELYRFRLRPNARPPSLFWFDD